MKRYIDFKLIEKHPNKYNLTPKNIKKLKILNWDKLKKYTWYNSAMKKTGEWWCHLEGSGGGGWFGDNEDTFWIGFRKEDNKIDCHFTSCEGMCHYKFEKFYDVYNIENKWDMNVQVNTIKFLNMLIDEGILGIEKNMK